MTNTKRMLDFHDSVITKINIDRDCVIIIEINYIPILSNTKIVNVYKPKMQKAVLKFINCKKANLDLNCDMRNTNIILDCDLVIENDNSIFIHIFTSNHSTIDICCEKYILFYLMRNQLMKV